MAGNQHEPRNWRLDALKTAHKKHGRDYLRRLRRATRPPEKPHYRRYPPMLKLSSRQLALAGMVVLLLVVLAVVADADGRNSKARAQLAICQVFRGHCFEALKVASCETGGTFDPRAVGDHGSSLGLFQINRAHWVWVNEKRLFEPGYNARIAWRLSRGGRDWHHWTCRP